MSEEFHDEEFICSDHGGPFILTAGEKRFFAGKKMQYPRRCKPCRDKRKLQRGEIPGVASTAPIHHPRTNQNAAPTIPSRQSIEQNESFYKSNPFEGDAGGGDHNGRRNFRERRRRGENAGIEIE